MKYKIGILFVLVILILTGCASHEEEGNQNNNKNLNLQTIEFYNCSFNINADKAGAIEQQEDVYIIDYNNGNSTIICNYEKDRSNLNDFIKETIQVSEYKSEEIITVNDLEVIVTSFNESDGKNKSIIWFENYDGIYFIEICGDNFELVKTIVSSIEFEKADSVDKTEDTQSNEQKEELYKDLIDSVDNSNANDATEIIK